MALDKLEAMRAFCRIVELGSFSKAADALGVAKTTISGQIQTLEARLGITLLHRLHPPRVAHFRRPQILRANQAAVGKHR